MSDIGKKIKEWEIEPEPVKVPQEPMEVEEDEEELVPSYVPAIPREEEGEAEPRW